MSTYLDPVRITSVTIPWSTRELLQSKIRILWARGVRISEQFLLRKAAGEALQRWRGHGEFAGRPRRYNRSRGPFLIVPLSIPDSLRFMIAARCMHSAVSASRFIDRALNTYLVRIIAEVTQGSISRSPAIHEMPAATRFQALTPDANESEPWGAVTIENTGPRLSFLVCIEAVGY